MIFNREQATKVANTLLDIKAVKLSPENPFTWASGLKSPIYCDNRVVLSHPTARNVVSNAFAELIKSQYQNFDLIAGVATGGIGHGMLVAHLLNKPFVYVRSKRKEHGRKNIVEGDFKAGQKVVVIEDLISTGGSSLKAVEGLKEDGLEVLGLAAIYEYGFPKAKAAFEAHQCEYHTLSNYETTIQLAAEQNYISAQTAEDLNQWKNNPAEWSAQHA